MQLNEAEVLGLRDVHIEGTPHRLLGMPDATSVPNMAQRSAIARRIIEVGPLLPMFIPGREAIAAPTPQGEHDMPKNKGFVKETVEPKAEGATPGANADDKKDVVNKDGKVDTKAVEKLFEKNRKENEKDAAEKKKADAKAAKEKTAKEEARRKAAKLAKKKDPTPKTSPKKKDDKKPAAAPKKAGGIGGLVCKLLIGGKDTDAILAAVKKDFPKAKTSPASIAWYRSKLREEGKLK